MDRPAEPPADHAPLDDRVVAVFAAVVDAPLAERQRTLTELCGDDEPLRAAVSALLAEHDAPPPILGRLLDEATRRRDPTQAPGTMIGPFRILERIGQGGMGIVYRALQDRPSRVVALKVLSAGRGDSEQVSRFEREIEVLGRLQHPGICRIFGAGTADLGPGLDRTQWFAMEIVDGPPLVQFAQQHQLDVDARCLLLAAVADAIQHAHERGVVHRDLKPSNILVARDDHGAPVAKVLDFGIAHAVADDDEAAMRTRTRTGMLLGTIDYMSPEQLNGGPLRPDARSDVYSLGVVLYELLAFRLPHDLAGRTLTEVCRIVADRPAPPLSRSDRRLAGDLETIVQKAMAKDAADRFASAADFAADLRRHVRREPVLARRPTAIYQLKKFAQRNRATVAAVGATMALLAIGLVWVAVLAAKNDALATSEQGARKTAEAAGRQLRASLYRSQMRLGTEAMFAAGGVARARQIAADWLPGDGGEDLRGFEWRLLWASCHDETAVWPSLPAPARLRWLHDNRWFVSHQVEVRCVDAVTGRVLQEYVSPVEPVAPSASSADGRVFAHATAPSEVTLRELATGAVRAQFAFPEVIENVALSGDGQLCAVFSPPHGIAIHECATKSQVIRLDGAQGAMAFSDDGGRFAMARMSANGNRIAIWRTTDWQQPPIELPCSEAGVLDLAFDRAGARLAFSSFDGRLRVHAVESGDLVLDARHDDSLRGVAFAPDGARVAVGCRDYAVYVHDLADGSVRALRGHEGIPSAVAWSRDGRTLAFAGSSGTIWVWSVPTDVSAGLEPQR
ncbi:MAG: serine/threonine-protein kinase [Planctomycetota bacterium]